MADRAKPEPQPVDQATGAPASSAPASAPSTDSNVPRGGRGRGRARGRGRRVVPRQVARRKPPPKAQKAEPPKPPPENEGKGRGRGRGRGRGKPDGRGRGRGRGAPVNYNPNVVGLGQIAPARAPSRVPSSGGSGATSRKSSMVSSISLGAISSTDAGSSSGPVDIIPLPEDTDGGFGDAGGAGGRGGARGAAKPEDKEIAFMEHMELQPDSDDDMPESAFEERNRDIAPYAGKLTDDGLLLPVSLPGLRDLPPEYRMHDVDEDIVKVEKEESKPASIPGTKDEPMEIDSVEAPSYGSGMLLPEMFAPGTVAHKILSSDSALMFLQMPGLLALTESKTAPSYSLDEDESESKVKSSVAAAEAAAERMRGLGVDLRRVGDKGSTRPLGKLRFYKSGRVQIVMQTGGSLDLENGIAPRVCQQVVQINTKAKTCEELQNTLTTRLVGIPALGPL